MLKWIKSLFKRKPKFVSGKSVQVFVNNKAVGYKPLDAILSCPGYSPDLLIHPNGDFAIVEIGKANEC